MPACYVGVSLYGNDEECVSYPLLSARVVGAGPPLAYEPI